MAYGLKYKFIIESLNGAEVEIDVLKNGYSGSPAQRPLGAAPVLRQQKNDRVSGSSLAFSPECRVDGEYSEFYTTDPKEYRVELYREGTKIWGGYITPELYSEPDIAPPYDVNVTATDGLGELRRYYFQPTGKVTLHALFTALLSYTGQSIGVSYISRLAYGNVAYSSFFHSTYINMDYMAGKTCYEVLQYLLTTFNATISYFDDQWLVARENDVTVTSGDPDYITSEGTASRFTGALMDITSMGAGGLWPINFTSTSVDPAQRSIEVEAPWNLVSSLVNSDMLSDTGWTKGPSTNYNTTTMGYMMLPSGYVSQSRTQMMSKPLLLTIDAAMYLWHRNLLQRYSQVYLTVTFVKNGVTSYLAEDDQGGVVWTDEETKIKFRIESGTNRGTSTRNEVNLPPIYDENENPVSGTLTIKIAADGVQGLSLFGAHLTVAGEAGYKDLLTLDNGARGDAPGVTIAVGYETSDIEDHKDYYGGILLTSNDGLVTSLSTQNFSNLDFLSLISRDFARSIALPRLRTTGVLNTPAELVFRPLMLTHRGTQRWLETFEWNLFDDEMDFAAVSVPTAVITVADEVITASGSAAGSAANTVSRIEPGSGGGGEPGEDGLTITLSQYSRTFEATSNGYAKAATDNIYVRAFRGNTAVATTLGTITGTETGMSVTKVNSGTTTASLAVSVTTSLRTSGTIVIPVTADGITVNLRYSWALAIAGQPGQNGEDGEDGAPGKTPRGPSDYDSSTLYSGLEGVGDFVDYVLYNDKIYVCIKTPPAAGYAPTNTTYWAESIIQDFVATKLFFSEYAYIQNLGANAVKIANTLGAGFGGFMPPSTEGNGDTIFWAGAATPAQAPFTIDKNGNFHAASGTFSGYLRMPFESITTAAYHLSGDKYELAEKCNLYNSSLSVELYLPCTADQVGKVVNIWDVPVKTQLTIAGFEIKTSVSNCLYISTSSGTYGLSAKTTFNTGKGGYVQLVAVPGTNTGAVWMVTINSCAGFVVD